MSRFYIALFALLVCAGPAFAKWDDPVEIDRLPGQLKMRQDAPKLDELIKRVKPRFILDRLDFVWILHDEKGKPIFSMNRAYPLTIGKEDPDWCLLESKGVYTDDSFGPQFPYLRAVDPQPTIIAHDAQRGVVYQIRWHSSQSPGSSGAVDTRNIFLLCDGEHRWHLLEEGPCTNEGNCGASEFFSEMLHTVAKWTDDPAHPVELTFFKLTKDSWGVEGVGPDTQGAESITVREKMVRTAGEPNDDEPFKARGRRSAIVGHDETISQFIDQIARYTNSDEFDDLDTADGRKKSVALLRKYNPSLADSVAAGTIVVLPDELFPEETADWYVGDWQVTKVAGFAHISAMDEDEIAKWIGARAHFGADLAEFHSPAPNVGEHNDHPTYVPKLLDAATFDDDYRISPKSLGLPDQGIQSVDIQKSHKDWIDPAACLMLKSDGKIITEWDGVFFELTRR